MKKRVYLFMSQGTSFLSKLIKWYQYGNLYTHCGIILEDNIEENIDNPIVLAGMNPSMIGRLYDTHTGYFSKQGKFKYYYVEVNEKQYNIYKDLAFNYVNRRYDVKGLFGFLFRIDTNNPKKFFCSELVYDYFWKLGIELFQNTAPYEVYSSMLIKSNLVKEDKELNQKLWRLMNWSS